MPGPMPNPAARRRNTGSAFTELPAAGRAGIAPPYPLVIDDAHALRRAAMWRELWASPMAALWERHRWAMPVARYVEGCLTFEADPRGASVALMGELRQAEAMLMMTPSALLRARASIPKTPGSAVTANTGPSAGATVVDLSSWAG